MTRMVKVHLKGGQTVYCCTQFPEQDGDESWVAYIQRLCEDTKFFRNRFVYIDYGDVAAVEEVPKPSKPPWFAEE